MVESIKGDYVVSGLLLLFHCLLYRGRHLPAGAVLLVLNMPLNTLLKRGLLGHWMLVVPTFVHAPSRTLGKMCQLLWLVADACCVACRCRRALDPPLIQWTRAHCAGAVAHSGLISASGFNRRQADLCPIASARRPMSRSYVKDMGQFGGRLGCAWRQTNSMSGIKLLHTFAILGCSLVLSCGFSQNTRTATPASKPPWKFDGKVAWDSLVKQVAFGPRVPGTDPQIKCRDYLLAELKKGCDDAHLQHLTHHWSFNNKDVDIYNVIGTQNWKDAKVRVVLLAHWDSRPFADGPLSPIEFQTRPLPYKPIPGADDGASGVAVLLELAQALKDRHPDVGILYLLDDGEDLGPDLSEMLLGVDYFATHLPDPKPDYGILLDMIGNTNTVIPEEQQSMKFADRVVKAFYANAQEVGLGKTFPATDGDDLEDDHKPLIQRGIPTMDLIDFKYPQWHTVDDTPEHCSQKSLEAVGIALESFLLKQPAFRP